MKPEETVDYFLKIVWQSVANKYNQIASEYGITQALGYMLINIHEEGTAVSQIAALSGVKSTSLSRMLKNMEELGLIYREADPLDKRSVKIFLTDFGKEKRQVAKDVVRRFNEYLNSHVTETERLNLTESLKKINQLTLNYKPE
ncbi:MarR family winged helix-turn-helix transcriptional regulator [Daejeonella oryzae]|uniref:MarR family winged helix-turn-helix transcriptional regulator n=1 Tax=Daejeonella oryzae TaxID=1122943 RepID=UPI00040D9862|nr:MarR family transcriptional regulator [Daejeonella oryzae]